MNPAILPTGWYPTDARNSPTLMPTAIDISSFSAPHTSQIPSVFNPPRTETPAVAMPQTPVVSAQGPAAPSTNPVGTAWDDRNWFGKTIHNKEGGLNLSNIGLLVEGIGTLGSLWSAFQANNIAKDQLNFQKGAWEKNYANQVSSYNTALEDRAYSRAAQHGHDRSVADNYINRHQIG